MNDNNVALVLGASGLVGSQLVEQLLNDDRFLTVKIFVRRSTGKIHPKLQEYVVDFDQPLNWQQLVTGNVLFSAMGTTIKKAGTKKEQYKVDYHYQFNMAETAAMQGVQTYVLVSSMMADVNSKFFYTRMKGELERDIKKLPFLHVQILQPGMLSGDRKENRVGERVGLMIINFLNKVGIAKKYRPVDASVVAAAMIGLSFKTEKFGVHDTKRIFEIASQA